MIAAERLPRERWASALNSACGIGQASLVDRRIDDLLRGEVHLAAVVDLHPDAEAVLGFSFVAPDGDSAGLGNFHVPLVEAKQSGVAVVGAVKDARRPDVVRHQVSDLASALVADSALDRLEEILADVGVQQ